MTFGQYYLRLRRRLQDLRKVDGTIITDLTTNGSRWTASELIEVCNGSLGEAILLLQSNQDSLLYKQLGQDYFIAKASGNTDANGEIAIGSTILAVMSVDSSANSYGYIKPEKYMQYKIEGVSPLLNEYFFTVMQDVTGNQRKIFILPAAVVPITYSYIYSKTNYVAGDIDNDLHLQGIDWLLLDLAERECRDREHNWERSQILDVRISTRLGIKNAQNTIKNN